MRTNDDQAQMSRAIQMSLQDATTMGVTIGSFGPGNPDAKRVSGVPVGLANIGNTCYFNSLLQTYFHLIPVAERILSYRMPLWLQTTLSDQQFKKQTSGYRRRYKSCHLIESLKDLLAGMVLSDRKFLSPVSVIGDIVDESGNKYAIGEQKDVGEFNLVFLSRLQEGLHESSTQPSSPMTASRIKHVEGSRISESRHTFAENSLIADLFIGRLVYKNLVGPSSEAALAMSMAPSINQLPQEETQMFTFLQLKVKQGQLYHAIEEFMLSQIEGFRNQQGQPVTAYKQYWIQQLPKVFFFQIDRLSYDQSTGAAKKINDHFDFPLVFYADSFLAENRLQSIQLRNNLRSLRMEREKCANLLASIENYQGRQVSLQHILIGTVNFLKGQTNSDLPTTFQFPQCKDKIKVESFIGLMDDCRQEVQKRSQSLRQELAKIDAEILSAYNKQGVVPYRLFSILIHQGVAESGHYYSYTKDSSNDKWYKYSDTNIKEEGLDRVLEVAKGGTSASAYYLVYAQNDVLKNNGSLPLCSHALSDEEHFMTDIYSGFIHPDAIAKIVAANQSLQQQIDHSKIQCVIQSVISAYNHFFQICNKSFRELKDEDKAHAPPKLLNLPIYLKKLGKDDEYKNALIERALMLHGPKERTDSFEKALLDKVKTAFHEFKRPTRFAVKQEYKDDYLDAYQKTMMATRIYSLIGSREYACLYAFMTRLQGGRPNQYFTWLCSILGKTMVPLMLTQAQMAVSTSQPDALRHVQLAMVLLKQFSPANEVSLRENCASWVEEISWLCDNQPIRKAIMSTMALFRSEMGNAGNVMAEINAIFMSPDAQTPIKMLQLTYEPVDALWNLNRSNNELILAMLASRDSLKGELGPFNKLYQEMKKGKVDRKMREQLLAQK